MSSKAYEYNNIIDIASAERIPFAVTIELNTECNLRCEHCYIPRHSNKGMSTDIIKRILDELRNLGTFELVFTGGEIFLREDILEILSYSRERGFSIKLFTNVTLIDEKMSNKLAELPVSLISTSVYSLDDEIHDSITKKRGSLQQTLQGIDNICKYNIPLEVKMIVMKKNINSIKHLYEFCNNRNINFITSPFVFPKSDGDTKPIEKRIDSEISLLEIIDSVDEITKFTPIKHNDEDYVCPSMRYSMGIECNGNVNPCNALFSSVGNIYDSSIKNIWNSKKIKFFQNIKYKDLKGCQGCENKSFCIRCPGIALNETGDYLKPFSFACQMARLRNYKYKKRGGEIG